MKRATSKLACKMSAPSMVFGEDLVDNVQRLAGFMDHVEIVLFHTPMLHNFPNHKEIDALLNSLDGAEGVSEMFTILMMHGGMQ